jgi:hypothetical protein
MSKEFAVSILKSLYETTDEILTGDFCYKIFIELDKLHPKFIENNDDNKLYKIIYYQYTLYREMKTSELIKFFQGHLKAIEMCELNHIMENMLID